MNDDFLAIERQHALEDEICARLLAHAQVMRRELAQRAWEANLALTDFLALRHMIRSNYCFSPAEIARVLNCSRANATKIVKRLEAAGFISVRVDLFRPKGKSLSITFAGRHAYATAMRRADPTCAFARLSDEERKELYRLLGKIAPRVRQLAVVG